MNKSEGFLDGLGLLCIPINEPIAPVISCNNPPTAVLASGLKLGVGFNGFVR
jgi:hypothetical protein